MKIFVTFFVILWKISDQILIFLIVYMKCYSFLVFLGWTCSGVGSVKFKMELRFVTERTLTRFSGPLWRCFRYNSTSPLHSLHNFLYTNTFYNLMSRNNNNNTALLPLTIQPTVHTYVTPLIIGRLPYLKHVFKSYFNIIFLPEPRRAWLWSQATTFESRRGQILFWTFRWYFSATPGKLRDITTRQTTITTCHIISDTLFSKIPKSRRHVIWHIISGVK